MRHNVPNHAVERVTEKRASFDGIMKRNKTKNTAKNQSSKSSSFGKLEQRDISSVAIVNDF